jgi:hypothetical protein
MIKIENVETCNWRAAIRGMRNPLESWDKSDSYFLNFETDFFETINGEKDGEWDNSSSFIIGKADLALMKRLVNAGTDHSKFMRMITVSYDIVAPLYWWKEFDTYRIGVVRNSCSTMHKIEARELNMFDFARDGLTTNDVVFCLDPTINYINRLIAEYKAASGSEKRTLHQRIVKLLPDSYLQRATITTNYQVLRNIRNSDRKNHKLDEWRDEFMEFIDGLPYAEELLLTEETRLERNRKISCEDCICHYTDLEGNSKSCESFSKYYDQHGWHCVCDKKKYSATRNSEVYSFEPKDFHI